jgi:hypothetical protein
MEERKEWIEAYKVSRAMFVEAGVEAVRYHEEGMKQVDSTWMDINGAKIGTKLLNPIFDQL